MKTSHVVLISSSLALCTVAGAQGSMLQLESRTYGTRPSYAGPAHSSILINFASLKRGSTGKTIRQFPPYGTAGAIKRAKSGVGRPPVKRSKQKPKHPAPVAAHLGSYSDGSYRPRPPAQNYNNRPEKIRVVFDNTDAGEVLRAIGARTGASIVYAGKNPAPVTLNISVSRVEDAVRSVSSAAGLVYRRVDGVYVVAQPDQMRQALGPYDQSVTFDLAGADPAKVQSALQLAYPYAGVRTAGDKVIFEALPGDILSARDLISEYATTQRGVTPSSDAISLANASPAQVATALGTVYPDVKAAAAEAQKETAGGMLVLTGPADEVRAAKDLARRIDASASSSAEPATRYEAYRLKYTSAPVLMEFLKSAVPDVQAFVGPEAFQPQRPYLNLLSSTFSSATGGPGVGAGSGASGVGFGNNGQQQMNGGMPGNLNGPNQQGMRATTVVLRGSPAAIARALELVQSVDTKPTQIQVDVRVLETSSSLTDALGIDYGWTQFQFFELPAGSASGGVVKTRPSGFGQFSRTPWSFLATLNAKIQTGAAKILAQPNVQVVDNSDADIFIGDTLRAQVAQATGLGGQTVQIEEFPVGIMLLIHPRVNADGNITMHVNPVVSTVTAIAANNIPQTSSREAETNVIVKDGETIVIGGLIQDQFTKNVSAIPLLSQLPIVGQLFRNRTTDHTRTEVIVTITPHIIKDQTP